MAKNVMKMLKPSPKRGKNAFDLSHRHVLGANFGELLPITCLETVPGDYFEVNCADLLRAMPMVTSPFLRAKQHIDFWFVPYSDLWHQFNAFITQKQQPQGSAFKGSAYVPHINLAYIMSDIMSSSSAITSLTDVEGVSWQTGANKIFNLLGYGDATTPAGGSTYPDINLWRIAAYNYIWYNEYRQQYYDDGTRMLNSSQNAAHLFNFDDLSCDTYANANITNQAYPQARMQAMFQMRYRCWKKDLFTGLLPSTQFGALSTVDSVTGFDKGRWETLDSSAISGQIYGNNSSKGLQTGTADIRHTHASSFDVLSLRQAQAVQIWRENALRAGNRVNDNLRAHYGETPDYQRDHRPTYIGSYDAPLNISDVNATAQIGSGGNQSLGDVAGKGISSLDSRTLKFNCNDFGVIMGIFSILPEAEYNAQGIERNNQLLDRFDYFAPEMENLGLEAVSSQNFLMTAVSAGNIIGYAPRYYGYKTKLDKCFGQFETSGTLQIWCSPKYDVAQAISYLSSGYPFPLNVLYVNPAIYNVNFVADAATLGHQVLCDFFFDVKAVRSMTVLGLPEY